jgi:hypothetical protein
MNIAEKERKSNPKKVYFVLANKRAFHVPVQHFPLKSNIIIRRECANVTTDVADALFIFFLQLALCRTCLHTNSQFSYQQ